MSGSSDVLLLPYSLHPAVSLLVGGEERGSVRLRVQSRQRVTTMAFKLFLHELSAGFEPATLGVRVKLINHWATEEPVYKHTQGRSNSAELLQYII